MPKTTRRKKRPRTNHSLRRCQVEGLEDRRLLALTIDLNNPADLLYTGEALPIAPFATIGGQSSLSELTVSLHTGVGWVDIVPSHLQIDSLTGTNITAFIDDNQIFLSGNDSAANYQAALRSIKYYHDSAEGSTSGLWRETIAISSLGYTHTSTLVRWHAVFVADAEGTRGLVDEVPRSIAFTVGLSHLSSQTVSVHYDTEDGTALAGVHYEATSGHVTFAPGEQFATVTVPLVASKQLPGRVDPDLHFSIRLSDPVNTLLANYGRHGGYGPPVTVSPDPHATGTIYDSVITNALPDPLAGIVGNATVDGAYVSMSTLNGDISVRVPTIPGPLAENAALFTSPIGERRMVVSTRGTTPPGPGGVASATAYLEMRDVEGHVASSSEWGWFYSKYGVLSGSEHPIFAAPRVDNLPTGTYVWQLVMTYQFPEQVKVTYHGIYSLVNRLSSPYGKDAWMGGLDELYIVNEDQYYVPNQESIPLIDQLGKRPVLRQPAGITYVTPDGTAVFFPKGQDGTYATPNGYFLKMVADGTGYALRLPNGVVKRFRGDGLLASEQDPAGNEKSYQYNADKTIARVTDATDNYVTFGYTNGKLSSLTDTGGRTYEVQHASSIRVVGPPVNGDALVTTMGVSSVEFPTGELMYYSSLNGWVSTVSLADRDVYIAARNAEAAVSRMVNSVADEERRVFDDRGWVTEITDFAGNTTKYKRYDDGLIEEIILPGRSDPQFKFTYDDRGNMLTRWSKGTDLLPDSTETWTYDDNWNVPDTYTDAASNVTTYKINPANGQVESITEVLKGEDGAPNLNLLTQFVYSLASTGVPAGLLHKRIDPEDVETRYDYAVDGDFLVETITDAYGTSDAVSRVYRYERDTMNLKAFSDERQKVTDYDYDELDRIKKIEEPSPNGTLPRPDWDYDYLVDASGSETIITDPGENVTRTGENFINGHSIGLALPKPKPTSPVNPGWSNRYDGMGRLSKQFIRGADYTDYRYDANGNLTEVELSAVNNVRPNSPLKLSVLARAR